MNFYLNKIKNFFQKENGDVSILITVLVLSTVIVIVFGVSYIVVNLLKSSAELEGSLQAFYAADAGAEKCLLQIYSGETTIPSCYNNEPISDTLGDNDEFRYEAIRTPDGIRSDGFSHGGMITRRVEVRF